MWIKTAHHNNIASYDKWRKSFESIMVDGKGVTAAPIQKRFTIDTGSIRCK